MRRAMSGLVFTGRRDTRKFCMPCRSRIKRGNPKPTATWPVRLSLTREQYELLLCAAADFQEMGGGSVVEFVDWMAVDALGLVTHVFPESVGHSVTESGGSREGSLVVRHSSPDPLPILNRKVRV